MKGNSRSRVSIWLLAVSLLSPVFMGIPTGQNSPPVRLGDLAQKLNEQDLYDLLLLLPQRPWLLSSTGRGVNEVIKAYLPPTKETAEIRRGYAILLQPSPQTSTSWTVLEGRAIYAQVSVPGKAFEVQSDQDTNRPFTLLSDFDDSELLSLVSAVRSYSSKPISDLWTISPWDSGRREPLDEPNVVLRESATELTRLTLGKENGKWVVRQVSRIAM